MCHFTIWRQYQTGFIHCSALLIICVRVYVHACILHLYLNASLVPNIYLKSVCSSIAIHQQEQRSENQCNSSHLFHFYLLNVFISCTCSSIHSTFSLSLTYRYLWHVEMVRRKAACKQQDFNYVNKNANKIPQIRYDETEAGAMGFSLRRQRVTYSANVEKQTVEIITIFFNEYELN